ncbi:VOC family protein [Streptacidiphilus sp. N1-10]|uniref:VOC family protein n=1 Tax=Streptacidiphilus jeojiensis TaxID=3229225 RepID=A0ABV6XG67_9ACTN
MRSLSDLFRNVMQLGYVTDDIDAATAYFESTLGTVDCVKHYKSSLGGGRPPALGGEPGSSFVVVDGVPAEEWVIDVALVNAGATNLEIIRPVSGAVDLYRGAVRPGRPATLHHLGFRIDDFDEASAVVAAAGKEWAQFGVSGDIRFGYLDMTAELGHFVEVMELGPQSAEGFAQLEAASNAVTDTVKQ